MCGWCGNTSCFAGGWWWVIPLAVMALCIMSCFFMKSGFAGRRFRMHSGARRDDLEEIKKEIRALKEDINKTKEK